MSKETLRRFVQEVILKEEIVTVYRGKDSTIYDATFDEKGNLLYAKPFVTTEADDALVARIQGTTNVPPAAIYNLVAAMADLKNPKNPSRTGLQQVATSPQRVLNTIEDLISKNPEFADAFRWPPSNEHGRGEAALKLAFKFSDAPEPDFVSEDGQVKLSVKYFGDGATTVRSGVGGGNTSKIIAEMKTLVGIADFGKTYAGKQLMADLGKIVDPEEKSRVIQECKKLLDQLKYDLVTAHGSQAIFGHDAKGIYLILPEEAASRLKVYAIRESGARAEFFGPNVPDNYTSLDVALDRAASQ